ncbi:MAG: hypothetical protein AAGH64_07650, partial [Planctomycetota bacterium]
MPGLFNIRVDETLYGRIRSELDAAAQSLTETLDDATNDRLEREAERVERSAEDARRRAEGIAVRLEGIAASLAVAEERRMQAERERL